ncbi:MAG TPA: helix-turn-helix transcriptional regulator [Solirubrobacteraceae bacterium]|nr:helix-turn-helix transcriptional regulator [Solirubrobacteraceae bacterium]
MPLVSDAHVAFGAAVRRRRIELKLSQEHLADKTDLHRNYVGGVERGEYNLTLTSILTLARGLGVPAADLVAAAENAITDHGTNLGQR